MNYAKINYNDVTNGTGVRISLFVSGCHLNCPGCFNKKAQSFSYGKLFTHKELDKIIARAKEDFISGLSLLGGDPFAPENQLEVLNIVTRFKEIYPIEKDIFIWTGYTLSQLLKQKTARAILRYTDVLIDGPFILAEKDLRLKWRGSRNQNIYYKKDILKEIENYKLTKDDLEIDKILNDIAQQ